jgi:hypothetical protein
MKSVPNLISYLQEFSQIFFSLCIYFIVWKSIFENFQKWKKAQTSETQRSAIASPEVAPGLAERGDDTDHACGHKGVAPT